MPAVHPGLADWPATLRRRRGRRRAGGPLPIPTFYGIDPAGAAMRALAAACGEAGLPLILAVRFEDGRQRHPNDHAPELPAAAVRALIRSDPTCAPARHPRRPALHRGGPLRLDARRRRRAIWWDICWIWGPPEDHLQTLLGTIGAARFVLGTGQPLRIPENAGAKLDLLDCSAADRAAIESGNARALRAR